MLLGLNWILHILYLLNDKVIYSNHFRLQVIIVAQMEANYYMYKNYSINSIIDYISVYFILFCCLFVWWGGGGGCFCVCGFCFGYVLWWVFCWVFWGSFSFGFFFFF